MVLQSCFVADFRLEERQRAEKKLREVEKAPFVPKWFKPAGEVVETPWGSMDLFEFNGDYKEKRSQLDKAADEAADPSSTNFSPWQFESSSVNVGDVTAATGIVQSHSS